MNPQDELLLDYIEGTLDPDASARIEEQLASDPELAEHLAQMRGDRALLQQPPTGISPPEGLLHSVIAQLDEPHNPDNPDNLAPTRNAPVKLNLPSDHKGFSTTPPARLSNLTWTFVALGTLAASILIVISLPTDRSSNDSGSLALDTLPQNLEDNETAGLSCKQSIQLTLGQQPEAASPDSSPVYFGASEPEISADSKDVPRTKKLLPPQEEAPFFEKANLESKEEADAGGDALLDDKTVAASPALLKGETSPSEESTRKCKLAKSADEAPAPTTPSTDAPVVEKLAPEKDSLDITHDNSPSEGTETPPPSDLLGLILLPPQPDATSLENRLEELAKKTGGSWDSLNATLTLPNRACEDELRKSFPELISINWPNTDPNSSATLEVQIRMPQRK